MEHKRLTTFRDLGSVAFLILFPHIVPLPFYLYAIVCFLLIWFLLRKEGKTFRDIGLAQKGLTLKAVLIGIASALIWVGFMQFAYIPLIKHLFVVPDYTEYNFIKNSASKLIMTITAAWIIGGLYEEIVFRGYILSIAERRISGSRRIPWSIIVTSILFGLYHWQQGIFGLIAAISGGIFWSILYKKSGNNLWIAILSHAIFDTVTLVLIYTGRFGNWF